MELKTNKINYSLEGLRGLCALTVALSHVQAAQILFKKVYSPITYLHFSHLAVLLFFVLSGYVIGINHSMDTLSFRNYFAKRLIRIYPIYLITVLLCFIIEPDISIQKMLGSIFFLQGITNSLVSNVVLWSIHYEVLFYILFVFFYRSSTLKIAIQICFCIFISLGIWFYNSLPQIIGGYAAGFSFWLTGLLIAKISKPTMKKSVPVLSLILLLFVYTLLSPGLIILNGLGLSNTNRQIISVADLVCLPICFVALTELGGMSLNSLLKRITYLLSYSIPLFFIAYLLYYNRALESDRWITYEIIYLLALISFFYKSSNTILDKLKGLGAISYTLYIIHYPIGFFLGNLFNPKNISQKFFLFIFWIALSILISWFLEKKYQKKIKNYFDY